MGFTNSIVLLSVLQPLHGLTFALLHLACMRVMANVVPPGVAATAQAIYAFGAGLVTAALTSLSERSMPVTADWPSCRWQPSASSPCRLPGMAWLTNQIKLPMLILIQVTLEARVLTSPLHAACLKSPICASNARLKAGRAGAALDIGCEAPVACDDVGVLEDPQYGRHHEVAGGETVAIEIGLVAERSGEGGQALLHELYGTRPAQLRHSSFA